MDIAFDIYRDHWARESNRLRKLRHTQHFKDYFECNCSEEDIYSLRLESTPEGLFEVLQYIKEWILYPFGYTTDRWFSQIRNHQKFRLHTQYTLDTVVLTKNVYAIVLDSTTIKNKTIPREDKYNLMRRNFCGWGATRLGAYYELN